MSGDARLALLCPGQGGQGAGMFRLVEPEEAARAVLGTLATLVAGEVMAAVAEGNAGGTVDIYGNVVAQPLVVGCALAHWAALSARGLPTPTVFAGYSVGELSAHGCAGTVGLGEALGLATVRAALMEGAAGAGGGLLAVRGLPDAVLDAITREAGLERAIDNGPGHRVLGGREESLVKGELLARERGASTVRRLRVGVPAHTRWLAGASVAFEEVLSGSNLRAPTRPVLAGIDGAPVRDAARAVATLSRQLSEPVRWATCLGTAWEQGARVFLELPPGDALTRIARELLPTASECRAVSEFRTLDGVVTWVERRLG